ncbi:MULTISPECIES: aldo/keto reductase [unclassified Paenibacillus]|uniref:aldo/keto reductase n=1 Tax=unclassified Paenibacillus TaxID=185978 RepID=UPI002404C974|nr:MULTISPECIES: aldo/keto reductase [unclassified Paenibacillus]MDF9841614.1 diketogulonate reductase-like aldo/keto reductase [Paenibacillus sp. PastF-2]MDF9848274.1 diketogulonate reductase-like aldo/keto reductase [Paenibacillus sp. PastM-2]MDF9854773.1 diketogulonate reductase-like aldo/keto reductase [Paenibacillus sp. PastF-1]MDH6480043.1 diketogulonate reductase-like aldo/keto reductase [Paenibacillus sp. PastH-2]MDH6507476.1 diketogulonate reductase-like aldo/keto reductase [Paenibaci
MNNSIHNRVKLRGGATVPRIGQGTWFMGEDAASRAEEIASLRLGVELGMDLIDTAEMYGDGRSEELVGEAIRGIRDDVFLVSKVYPHNAGMERLIRSCDGSLKRLGTDHLDLYLLHWRGNVPLEETVEGMEQLVAAGKIKRWGVSNLDTEDMRELLSIPGGENCAVNQVLYHLGSRGIEHDLLAWERSHNIPIMAYSPLAQAGSLRKGLTENMAVRHIAANHEVTPLQILLAWSIREGDVIAIPKAASRKHVEENAAAASIRLSDEELQQLDEAFPQPAWRVPLDMI